MRRILLAALVLLAVAPATAIAAASWSAGDPSPLTHETIRIHRDWFDASRCSRRSYDWIGEMQASVDGRYAAILYVAPGAIFWADRDRVVGVVSWTPGSRVCVHVYNLLFDRPVGAALHIQDARVLR